MTAQIIPFPTNRKNDVRVIDGVHIWCSNPETANYQQIADAMKELDRVNKSASSAMKYALNMVGRMPPCA